MPDDLRQIDVDSEMKKALAIDAVPYQPVFRGKELEIECGKPETSLKNLRQMLEAGLKVSRLEVGPSGNVLVVFSSGETYLANGFSVGEKRKQITAFAKFAIDACLGGTIEEWLTYLNFMPDNFTGALQFPPPNASCDRPKVFHGKDE